MSENLGNRPYGVELLAAVREALSALAPQLGNEAHVFELRVATRALDILARELAQAPAAAEAEHAGLRVLLGVDGERDLLNRELCARLRDGRIAADDPALLRHLRLGVKARLTIDNPGFA